MMDRDRWRKVSEIFDRVLEAPADARTTLIAQLCDGDDSLRAEVTSLVNAAAKETPVLDGTAAEFAAPALGELLADAERIAPDQRIGPYRVIRRLGRGGMSVVYLVERDDDQFRAQAALKVLAQTQNSADAVRRFQAERQILASLDHPAIARISDGGVTPWGDPYLVMEYVDGVPITEFCVSTNASIAERLRLFETVCGAVHHAHQRLVVHRDIKPGNILVRKDGQVRLLDFGIAKLLDGDASSIMGALPKTRTGFRLLTPDYAAPEQVRGGVITTATDVYTLGVLLYELLAGSRPYDIGSLTLGEIDATICELDPPRPSTRAGRPRLRGDLDTIVMKALRKDPAQRYATPAELAEDLRRYREGFPIQARSMSLSYRTRRYARRHRAAIFVIAAAFAGLLYHSWQVTKQRDTARRETAKAEQVTTFLQNVFAVSDPDESRGESVTARELLQNAVTRINFDLHDQPEARADLLMVMAAVHDRLGLYETAAALADDALRTRAHTSGTSSAAAAESMAMLGRIRGRQGDFSAADSLLRVALEINTDAFGVDDLTVATTLNHLAGIALEQSNYPLADSLYRSALDIRTSRLGPDHLDVAEVMANLAVALSAQRKPQEAEPLVRDALRIRREHLGDLHTEVATSLVNLGDLYIAEGKNAEAVVTLTEAVRIFEHLQGDAHPTLASALNALGVALLRTGQYAAADSALQRGLAIQRGHLGEEHPRIAKTLNDIGVMYRERGEYERAEPMYRESFAMYRKLLGDDHAAISILQANLAFVLLDMERWDEAEELLDKARGGYLRHFGEKNERLFTVDTGLAMVAHGRGDAVRAEHLYRTLLAITPEYYPEPHWRPATVQIRLGKLYTELARYEEAEPLLSAGVAVYVTGLGDQHLLTATARVWLAECLVQTDRLDEAGALLATARATEEALLTADHKLLRETASVEATLQARQSGR